MNNLIKKEQLSGQKVVVGDKHTDLVLRTLGRVYIQTGSKMTLLNDLIKSVEQSANSVDKDSIIVIGTTSDLNSLEYPGEGKFVFIKDSQNLYITFSGTYLPIIAKNEAVVNWDNLKKTFVAKTGDKMSGDLEANALTSREQLVINEPTKAPLKVISSEMVRNFNSHMLGGLEHTEFAKKKENEIISGSWDFKNNTTFSSDTIHGGSLWSKGGFASGFGGYGWMLDAKTNTLTIDNLVVRKTMNVYELVVNKISATNGSLWVSDSAKIDSFELVYMMDPEDPAQDTNPVTVNGFVIRDPELDLRVTIEMANNDKTSNITVPVYEHYFKGNFYSIVLDEDNAKYCPFRVNDIIRCQKFTGKSIKFYNAIVTKIGYKLEDSDADESVNHLVIRLENSEVDPELTELNSPEIGDGVVRVGNISDDKRQGAVYITSSDDGAPFIDVTNGMNRPDFSVPLPVFKAGVLQYETPTVVRLGRIDGIRDPAFGVNQPNGMGLVAENVFLKGKFVQVEGGIEYPMPLFRGVYDPEIKYNFYDYVTYNSTAYIFMYNHTEANQEPVSGIAPDSPENAEGKYWKVYLEGVSGSDGSSFMYAGVWDAEKQYYIRDDVRTMISVTSGSNTSYYQTKVFKEVNFAEIGTPTSEGLIEIPIGEQPWNPDSKYWKSFGGQFSSIATDLILAPNAWLAGFRFKDGKLTSEWGKIDNVESSNTLDPNFKPHLEIDGTIGSIKATLGYIGGWNILEKELSSNYYNHYGNRYRLLLQSEDPNIGPSIVMTKMSDIERDILQISSISSRSNSSYYPSAGVDTSNNNPGIFIGYDNINDMESDDIYGYDIKSKYGSMSNSYLNLYVKQGGVNSSPSSTNPRFPNAINAVKTGYEYTDPGGTTFYQWRYDVVQNTYLSAGCLKITGMGFDMSGAYGHNKTVASIALETYQTDTAYFSTSKSSALYLSAKNTKPNTETWYAGSSTGIDVKTPVFGLITEGLYLSRNNNSLGVASNTLRILAYVEVSTNADDPQPIKLFYSADNLLGGRSLITGVTVYREDKTTGGRIQLRHSLGHSMYRILAMSGYGYCTANVIHKDYFEISTADDATKNPSGQVCIWIVDIRGAYGVDYPTSSTFKIKDWISGEVKPENERSASESTDDLESDVATRAVSYVDPLDFKNEEGAVNFEGTGNTNEVIS